MALADNAWRAKDSADWPAFIQALDAFLPRLEKQGIGYARSMFNISHTVKPHNGQLQIELTCERPDVEIRYTLSPSPTVCCGSAAASLLATPGSTLTAATFKDGQQVGKTLTLPLVDNQATGCSIVKASCTNGLADRLTNGVRGSDRHSDFEWAGWYNTNADFVVDLGSPISISSVTLGAIANANMTVALPYEVCVYGSSDGQLFTQLGSTTLDAADIFAREAKRCDIVVPLTPHLLDLSEIRYIQVQAIHPGPIPEGYIRGGQSPWMYFDEIIVE